MGEDLHPGIGLTARSGAFWGAAGAGLQPLGGVAQSRLDGTSLEQRG